MGLVYRCSAIICAHELICIFVCSIYLAIMCQGSHSDWKTQKIKKTFPVREIEILHKVREFCERSRKRQNFLKMFEEVCVFSG